MKFTKLLILASLLSIGVASAQKYSIEVGSVSPKQFGSTFSTTYFNGIRVGANVQFDLKNNFSLLTGALYSFVYNNKAQYYSTTDSVVYTTFGHYIDVPLRLKYEFPITKDLKVFGFAGPNINIGLAEPQKIDAQLSTLLSNYTGIKSVDYKDNDLFKNALIRRINFQIGAGGGVQWKKWSLKGGYDFGINSLNEVDSSRMLHQSGWYVSLAYQF